MYTSERQQLFKSSVAQIDADGILVDITNGIPHEEYDNSVPHHILLSWTAPRSILGQAWFGTSGATSRLVDVGNLTFIPAGVQTRWRFRPEAGIRRVIAVRFNPDMFDRLDTDSPLRSDLSSLASYNFSEPDIQSAMKQLAREALAPGFASKTLIESIGTNLLIQLARRDPQHRRDGVMERSGLAPWQMRRIMERIADASGADSIPSLAELAALAGISTSHLRRGFKQSTGGTVGDHIRNVRLDRAHALLSGTALTLGEIAARLGFSSHYGFTLAFRRETGETPSAYRRRLHRPQ